MRRTSHYNFTIPPAPHRVSIDDSFEEYKIDPEIKAIRQMYSAVLLKAFSDLYSVDKDISAAARRWVVDDTGEEWVLSFSECCEILDFEGEVFIKIFKGERLL